MLVPVRTLYALLRSDILLGRGALALLARLYVLLVECRQRLRNGRGREVEVGVIVAFSASVFVRHARVLGLLR